MASTAVNVVPGLADIGALHARELPQKDNLCGAFWAALVLQAAGFREVGGAPLDQDLVALHAGTRLPPGSPAEFVPRGAASRSDYRLPLPRTEDPAAGGTSVTGLGRAFERLSGGTLAALPVAGPWSGERVLALVEAAAAVAPGTTLVANLRSGRLWGTRPAPRTLLEHLAGRPVEGPPPEWDVGHFNTLVATARGARASLVLVRDTYPSLGWNGYHLQPPEALAAALERGDGLEGGVLCLLGAEAEGPLRERLDEAGYELRYWDNGTPDEEES